MTTEFGFNSKYLTKNNKPWFPIMGEMHYSRYPKEYWEESLYKMKAGGVDVVSAYTIWIHHEEMEGEYDFTGNKDLRTFVQTCKKTGNYLMLRIGPWVHAEVRNGGFPDWLLKKGYELRSNDSAYLSEVRKYYSKLYQQVEGLLLKDGGPIIGLQIENELGHCGGAYGEAGEKHIQVLTQMAMEIGFEVPFYTATGWGGASTGGLLPVMGGYCEAPWDQRLTEIEPSGNYVFTYERNDHNIGNDHGLGAGVTFDYDKFPFLMAELGGGLQVTHHRRPVAEAKDIGAMSLAKLGSGCNLLGYYMYHGGTNPKGKLSTLQESRATGYPNDLPELNYDFRAPIREYGQISETSREIKLLAMFVKDFGEKLCDMPAYIPEDNPVTPINLTDLRYSIRHDGQSGYLFVNNYQRRYPMEGHKNIILTVKLPNEIITYPAIDVKDKDFFFYPFNLKLDEANLKTALATPLCILHNEEKAYVFYSDEEPKYDIQGDLKSNKLITISRAEALNAWKVTMNKEHLIISDAAVIQTDYGIQVIRTGRLCIKVYPEFDKVPEGWSKVDMQNEFAVYEKDIQQAEVTVNSNFVSTSEEVRCFDIQLNYSDETLNDCFLSVHYQGDRAKLFYNEELIADHFYTGRAWEIGLKRFDFPERLRLEIYPLYENDQIFLEQWPEMVNGVACVLSEVTAEVEYQAYITK